MGNDVRVELVRLARLHVNQLWRRLVDTIPCATFMADRDSPGLAWCNRTIHQLLIMPYSTSFPEVLRIHVDHYDINRDQHLTALGIKPASPICLAFTTKAKRKLEFSYHIDEFDALLPFLSHVIKAWDEPTNTLDCPVVLIRDMIGHFRDQDYLWTKKAHESNQEEQRLFLAITRKRERETERERGLEEEESQCHEHNPL